METRGALIEEWPKISFRDLEKVEVEGGAVVQGLYKSFFTLLRLPETMFSSLVTLFKEEP